MYAERRPPTVRQQEPRGRLIVRQSQWFVLPTIASILSSTPIIRVVDERSYLHFDNIIYGDLKGVGYIDQESFRILTIIYWLSFFNSRGPLSAEYNYDTGSQTIRFLFQDHVAWFNWCITPFTSGLSFTSTSQQR